MLLEEFNSSAEQPGFTATVAEHNFDILEVATCIGREVAEEVTDQIVEALATGVEEHLPG